MDNSYFPKLLWHGCLWVWLGFGGCVFDCRVWNYLFLSVRWRMHHHCFRSGLIQVTSRTSIFETLNLRAELLSTLHSNPRRTLKEGLKLKLNWFSLTKTFVAPLGNLLKHRLLQSGAGVSLVTDLVMAWTTTHFPFFIIISIIFISDTSRSEERQKLAKERREEKAKYLGKLKQWDYSCYMFEESSP